MYLNTFKRSVRPSCAFFTPKVYAPKLRQFPLLKPTKLYFPKQNVLYLPKLKNKRIKSECLLNKIKNKEIICPNCTKINEECCMNLKVAKNISLDKGDILEYLKMLKDIIIVLVKYYLQVRFMYRKPKFKR